MKIFYAVQATGNGHISRASEVMPHLEKHGHVDVFLSGSNYGLPTPLPVRYRSKGVSLFYNDSNGSIDLCKTITSLKPGRIWKEIMNLPLEKYDVIINDFECITSMACLLRGIPSIHFGHQASFSSTKVPRPEKRSAIGEWVLSNYAKGSERLGLHFKSYDEGICTPIIRSTVIEAEPSIQDHITVYLGQYSSEAMMRTFSAMDMFKFHVFAKDCTQAYSEGNVRVFPLNLNVFTESMQRAMGVITGAGFETPAEAMYLGKKLMILPLKGQYEQECNASALKEFGAVVMESLDDLTPELIDNWMSIEVCYGFHLEKATAEIVDLLFEKLNP